jgi:anthranilate phosphoribosyltransferase
MHGSNDFAQGIDTAAGLRALGLEPAESAQAAAVALRRDRFAYITLRVLDRALDHLLGMRRLFGLRSPVNTVARLLNPADAPAGVDGVFHPPYIALHLGVAERLGRGRLIVLKGGGGEAERTPLKPATAAVWDTRTGRGELALPAIDGLSPHQVAADTPDLFAAVWRGDAEPETAVATVQATIALALLALGRSADAASAMNDAAAVWAQRR